MRLETLKYLHDMRQACLLLRQFTLGKTERDYLSDPFFRSAVERQFMIVGEALWQALKIERSLAERITDSRRIVNFRHIIVHGYAAVEHETVWGVVQRDVPVLLREVEVLLEEGER